MPAIPSVILKKLYVAGSLRNTPHGCQFQIKNTLAPATITGVGPIVIDGTAYPPQQITLLRGDEPLNAADAKPGHGLRFDVNVVVTIVIAGDSLAPGEHTFGLDVSTREAGRLKVEMSDQC